MPNGFLFAAYTRDRRDPYAKLDAARLEAAIAATRPRREPGQRFSYSNYAMGLLGYVLALRAGTNYQGLVRARICEPLGLGDTWIDTPTAERARVAAGHDRRGRETSHWNLAALAGAGGLRSTAADLLAFLGLHAHGSDSTLAAAARDTRRRRARLGVVGVGLGWLVLPPGAGPRSRRLPFEVLVHEGGTGGFRSFAAVARRRAPPWSCSPTRPLGQSARHAGAPGRDPLARTSTSRRSCTRSARRRFARPASTSQLFIVTVRYSLRARAATSMGV